MTNHNDIPAIYLQQVDKILNDTLYQNTFYGHQQQQQPQQQQQQQQSAKKEKLKKPKLQNIKSAFNKSKHKALPSLNKKVRFLEKNIKSNVVNKRKDNKKLIKNNLIKKETTLDTFTDQVKTEQNVNIKTNNIEHFKENKKPCSNKNVKSEQENKLKSKKNVTKGVKKINLNKNGTVKERIKANSKKNLVSKEKNKSSLKNKNKPILKKNDKVDSNEKKNASDGKKCSNSSHLGKGSINKKTNNGSTNTFKRIISSKIIKRKISLPKQIETKQILSYEQMEQKMPSITENEYKNYKEKVPIFITRIEYLYCIYCKFNTDVRVLLYQHYRDKHTKQMCYECNECVFISNTPLSLKKHVTSVHCSNDKKYQCYICDYQTDVMDFIQKHTENVHNMVYFNNDNNGSKL